MTTHVLGARPDSIRVASGSAAITEVDYIIKVTGVGTTHTLPSAVGLDGAVFIIDNASAGGITVDTTAAQTIQGQLTQTLGPDSAMAVYSDGANWRIF